MRKSNKELIELCNNLGIKTLWSWSRYHCYKQDRWEYYLKYILHEKEDRANSIYCIAGNAVHHILEDFYNNKITYEELQDRYEDALFTMHCAELKYNRSNSEKNDAIANKYETCIRHFFQHHNIINSPHKVEAFVLIKVSDQIYFQGYADFIYIENVGSRKVVHIVDYKTSTKYSGDTVEAYGKQLMLYAEGIRQMLNIPLEDIVCEWNFLKYATVTYEQKNGKKKDRHMERTVIGESLVNTVKMWLKYFSYGEDDIEKYTDEMVLNNNIDCLPLEVKKKFEIKDCYVQVPVSEERIEQLKAEIVATIMEIEQKTEAYSKTKNENLFWQDVTDADEYRLNCLSSYSRAKHKPYDAYLKNKELFLAKENKSGADDTTDETDLIAFINSL